MSYHLELRNDVSELQRMSGWIHRTGKLMELPNALLFELDLCATEAVLNIINYAYDDSASHQIHIRLSQAQSHVDLEVEDDGRPFNPLEFAPAPAAASIEHAPLGGRGIQLIRRLMTECKYRRLDGKNILTMISRPRAPAG